ncbi:signal peptidase I [Salinirubrum litoreum]|uniref:Signal peptidase I n=1 Tax=Salinirubrum litoreum TaxID=1126234 RepID=A0ABD5R672_9EURY|nr:signal peptidase I [Salinirubrum litoreum]
MKRVVALLAVLTIAVVVAPPPTPLNVSYVTSDSMEPTIHAGDGYLLLDAAVETGDVVTYRATDGAYVTHRVVGETDAGYLTQGDANPSTDQTAGAPPVTDDRIVGRVVTLGGSPVTVPGVGPLFEFVDRFRLELLGGIIALLSLDLLVREETARDPTRPVTTVGDVVPPLLVGFTLAGVLALTIAASPNELVYVATETATPGGRTIPVGETVTREVTASATQLPFTTVLAESTGAQIVAQSATDAGLDLTLSLPGHETTGPRRVTLTTSVYPTTLPAGVLADLHAVHPLVARLASVGALTTPFAAAYLLLFDARSPLRLGTTFGRWAR